MQEKTIAFIFASSDIGGAELNTLQVIKTLNKKEFKPIAITPKNGPFISLFKKEKIPIFISKFPHHFGKLSTIEKHILTWRIKSL